MNDLVSYVDNSTEVVVMGARQIQVVHKTRVAIADRSLDELSKPGIPRVLAKCEVRQPCVESRDGQDQRTRSVLGVVIACLSPDVTVAAKEGAMEQSER